MVLAPARETEHSYWMRGDGTKYMARTKQPDADPTSAIPTSQIFAEGNGGESRKSFHGYPDGVAQLVESPVKFVLNPMQIDTYNRDLKLGDLSRLVPCHRRRVSPGCRLQRIARMPVHRPVVQANIPDVQHPKRRNMWLAKPNIQRHQMLRWYQAVGEWHCLERC